MKIQILRKRLNILIERRWVLDTKFNGLINKIGTLGNKIMVRTTIEITTICMGTEIGLGKKMTSRRKKMIMKTRVAFMFH